MLAVKNDQGELVGEALQFVTFDLLLSNRTLSMALNVQKVKEVVDLANVSPVPSSASYMLGVYDLRGCPVPVLDVQSLISKSSGQGLTAAHKRLVICELQNIWIAFPVEHTGRIVTCPTSDFLPPPPGGNLEKSRIVAGLIRREKSYIPVLDIDSLMDAAGFNEDSGAKKEFPAGSYSGKRVLVVDDSKVVLKRMVKLFERLGFAIDTAETGKQGLDRFAENTGKYDLIFTDIEMPVLDGIAMVREIRAQPAGAKIPILFNSALSNPALVSDIKAEALGEYIVKFDEDLILRKLAQIFPAIADVGMSRSAV